jgi:phosphoribosylanthranilate isomerase
VKICGITRPEDAGYAEACGADAVGVVMFSASPREVTPAGAEKIFAAVGPFCTKVAVTHTTLAENLSQILEIKPDAVQISHGFPRVSGVKVLRVIAPGDSLRKDCDALVIDGSRGNAIPFDPAYALEMVQRSTVPVILAGGLTPHSVRRAVKMIQPYAVDVSSGVERAPGIKDWERIRSFIHAVRMGNSVERGSLLQR